MKEKISFIVRSVINSYSILFFSQNKVLGSLLLAVSFVNPAAGLAGLLSTLLAIALVSLFNYDRQSTGMGFYSFNALLLGIGAGTFYQLNVAFFAWLIIICIIVTMLSVSLANLLAKYGLPLLSFPFIITFWLLLLAANSIYHMGLVQSNSAILNELNTSLHASDHLSGSVLYSGIIFYGSLFFRSLSAVLFQNNIYSGAVIAIGLLIHSRINFSLLVIAFITAILSNNLMGIYPEGISYYHLGANFMLTSGAIGCFFLIPSFRSYCCAVIVIPIIFLMVNAFTRVFGFLDLPVLSLPFCVVTALFLLFFRLLQTKPGLQLTPLQHYSPERNLYQFINAKERLDDLKYFRFELPFMGSWFVSQGYDGQQTHKGEWAKALDFVIRDEEGNTCQYPGERPEDFYSFGKPVLACGDGIIEGVVDHLEDNEIGVVNLVNNWGNTVIIKHLDGLYSKVSHLKKNSIKVKHGDYVKAGDQLGSCGNSGRSPEPHLHFQVQVTPFVGSKTIAYPFAYYFEQSNHQLKWRSFSVPQPGNAVSPIAISNPIKQAFNFLPGYVFSLSSPGRKTEAMEVFTDALNQSYIYSKTTGAAAYFINNGTSFYFTSFYGSHRSLLYYFYLVAYKINFTDDPQTLANDSYPLQINTNKAALWLQDISAPFYQFIQLKYYSFCKADGRDRLIQSIQNQEIFGKSKQIMSASIQIRGNTLKRFIIDIKGVKIEAEWVTESIY